MDTKILKTGPWKRASVAAAGFGFGGMLWGLEAYRGTVGAGESFTNPFSYILGTIVVFNPNSRQPPPQLPSQPPSSRTHHTPYVGGSTPHIKILF